MRRLLVATLVAFSLLAPPPPATSAPADTPKWDTEVFSLVPAPGYPAYVMAHRNGRVYAGTYAATSRRQPSRVFEWSADGTLLRSWSVPRQDHPGEHGVQVAAQTRDGLLVVLDTTTSSVLTLDTATARWRRVARLPGGAVPNYATWGPGDALYVTDYGQGVLWKVRRDGEVVRWFDSPRLEGAGGFGTTGIAFRAGRSDLLITQQTISDGSTLPTNGALLRLPLDRRGRPGALETLWTSLPTDLPDGFGIGRSGHIYIANAGLTAQLVELSATGEELDRFPDAPGTGENGSTIPFDTPCSATFLGTRVLVANQSAVQGDATHQAILSVEVGERGRPSYLPRGAVFR